MPDVLQRWPVLPGAGWLLFATAAAATIAGSLSMQDMGEVPMPGGWLLSAAWLPMCGQSWAGAAASFTSMWALMMAAMMLPAVLPQLAHARAKPALLAGAAYFCVWTVLGAIVFALGAAVTQVLLQLNAVAQLVPALSGLVVIFAGALQFTPWKARHLACCRQPDLCLPVHGAWRHGLRLGRHCVCACASITMLLLVMGVMDLRAMALVTAAITAERLAADGQRVARATGVLAVAAGVLMTVRALWPA